MIDIAGIVNDKLKAMQENGKIAELVDKHVTAMMEGIVRGLFESYSEPRKELEKSIKDALKIDLQKIGLPEYNKSMVTIMQRILEKQITNKGLEKFEADVRAMLTDEVPERMKLSELMEKLIEHVKDDDGEEYGEISFHYEESRYSSRWIHFDDKPYKEKHCCNYKILINDNGDVPLIEIGGKRFDKTLIMGGLYGFDALLFKIYSAGTLIECDPDNVRTSWGD